MHVEGNSTVDVRNVCPKSGRECDFFVGLNEDFTTHLDVDHEVLAGLSLEDANLLAYNPQRHADAIDGARRIAVKNCVAIDENCGLPSRQKSANSGHHHHR